MRVVAILVGAGRGERMAAGRPKAFLLLGGQSLLLRSAAAFDAASDVDSLIAVVPADRVAEAGAQLAALSKPVVVVAGGELRQDSVRAGLAAIDAAFEGVVLIHDAARPFVSGIVIAAVVDAARQHGAALPVVPISDTVKRVRQGRVAETLDRTELHGAQTPQGFQAPLLRRALEAATSAGRVLTDEAMAVERLGAPVFCVAGSPGNRKLTTPDDLRWAESVLSAKGPA